MACLAVLSRRSLARRRIEKFNAFKTFRELRPEFPGVDSEWQNNYPKGTTQIESNNTMNKPIQIQIDGPRTNVLACPFPRSTSTLILITLVLACFAFSPAARAVFPAPGGGYPGYNTAEGDLALYSLTTGLQKHRLQYSHRCGGAYEQHNRQLQHSHGRQCA